MLVRNDCHTDYRVLKEAHTLAHAGYLVTVVAVNTYGPLEREERQGFEIVRVPVERARTRFGRGVNLFPRAIWRMAEAARQASADVYHAHDSDAILPAWLAARRVPGARLLYDAHEVGFLSLVGFLRVYRLSGALPLWLWSRVNDWIVRHYADAVISVNDVLADLQSRHYRVPRPAVVMNCPPRFTVTEDSRPVLSRRLGISPGVPIVLCQGILVRERHGVGLENLVRSASFLHRGVVVILGRGPQFEELERLAEQPEYAGRVYIVPAVPPTELLTYTSGASVGMIPTEIWEPTLLYASPNKLFEYMGAGLPVVTSDLPIVRRICEEYQCGLICDPTRPESMADAVNQILDDPDLYATMHAGALRAAEVYNWEEQEKVLLGVYERLSAERISDA